MHDDCEHALHIVGKAQHAVIRNNVFRDFNAAIKVNGHANDYPDGGILESNTFYNTTARNTTAAATPIDIVATNDWLISENFIFDIQKSAGDRVSYAAFAKGNASGTIFERNLVICEANVKGGQHTAIGLSLGGGGTGSGFFRSDIETIEHARGAIRNNIIMHCPNDVGVYINNSDETLVENNIIYNTVGVDVRYSKSNVIVRNNVISGRVRERDGGKVTLENNLIKPRYFINGEDQLKRYFKAADIADFGWIDSHDVELTPRENAPSKTKDFCGSLVSSAYLGAFAGLEFCNKN